MSEPVIHIGSVKVPLLDYAVSCTAILGIRDSGKTVSAKGIAEQLLDHNIPIVVFDAVGKWRWMKVPGPGSRGRGYRVVVAGGRKPDLPLNPHSIGEVVRSAITEKIPLIVDLYDPNLSKAQWRGIVKESIRIIHYEAVGVAHVFLEEAAEFIPQKPTDFDTYAEVEKLARMGGNASVGITLISQRAQEVNKAVLDLAVNLILGCQVGSKAIEWIGKWLDRLSPETAKAVTTSLPKLKSGEGWVWTRSNLDEPSREQMPMCRSLHPDRRTPDVVLKSAKAVDPETFVKRLTASIPKIVEEAKAADPREWAKEKRELNARIKKLESATPITETKTKTEIKTVEKRIVITSDITRLEKLQEDMRIPIERIETLLERAHQERSHIAVALTEARELNAANLIAPAPIANSSPRPRTVGPAGGAYAKHIVKREPKAISATNGDFRTSSSQQRILDSLAWGESMGLSEMVKSQLALLADQSPTSGGFFNNLGSLRSAGLLDYPSAGNVALTEAGRGHANLGNVPTTNEELHNQICAKLSGSQTNILRELIAAYPDAIKKDALAERVGQSPTSGGFFNNLGRLRTLKLIDYPQAGYAAATPILFIE